MASKPISHLNELSISWVKLPLAINLEASANAIMGRMAILLIVKKIVEIVTNITKQVIIKRKVISE